MSGPPEQIYSAEQIKIPVAFPYILRMYAKAAIRTQPYDLLRWTVAYFRALASGEQPPVKRRLEYPPFEHPSRITPGFLKTILDVFGPVDGVCLRTMLEFWQGLALEESSLYQIATVGGFIDRMVCDFYPFLGIACGLIASNLTETMILVCELLTEEPEGGSAMIPLPIFLRLYGYLADLDCSGLLLSVCHVESDLFPCGAVSTPELSSVSAEEGLICYEEAPIAEDSSASDVSRQDDEQRKSSRMSDVPDDSNVRESDTKSFDNAVEQHPERHSSAAKEDEATSEENLKAKAPTGDAEDKEEEDGGHQDEPDEHRRSSIDPTVDKPEGPKFSDVEPPIDFDYGVMEYEGEGSEMALPEKRSVHLGVQDIPPCVCPDVETISSTTTAAPDPFEEFLNRMRSEETEDSLRALYKIDGIGPRVNPNRVTAVGLWMAECARRQEGLVGPRNFKHFLCPGLDDTDYDGGSGVCY